MNPIIKCAAFFYLLVNSFSIYGQTLDSLFIIKADSLIKLNRELVGADKYPEALQVIEYSDSLCLATVGNKNKYYANSRFNHGRTLDFMNQYDPAEALYIEAIEIWDNIEGKKSPAYCWALNNLAGIYKSKKLFAQADSMYTIGLIKSKQILGPASLSLGVFLYNHAHLCNNLGYYNRALTLLLESQEVMERAVGKNDPDYYGWILIELGDLYGEIGQYRNAEQALLQVKAVWAIAYGKEHQNYAAALNNLANCYERLAEYDKIEPLLYEAINIQKNRIPFNESDYALSRYNLAIYYYRIGKYREAKTILLETTEIQRRLRGERSEQYALSEQNIASVYTSLGEYDLARACLLKSIDIRKEIFNGIHPKLAKSMHNLGFLYMLMGKYDSSAIYFKDALEMRLKTVGKEHPAYSESLRSLGELYALHGSLDTAEILLKEVLLSQEASIGKSHPEYAISLSKLADIYIREKKYKEAEPVLISLENLNQQFIAKSMFFLTENELDQYRVESQLQSDIILSVLKKYRAASTDMLRAAFAHVLFYKGLLLEKNMSLENALSAAPDSVKQLSLNWKGYQRHLYDLYLKPKSQRDSSAVSTLEALSAKTEQQLVRLSSVFGDIHNPVTFQQQVDALGSQQAAVEFIHFQGAKSDNDSSVYYAALVLLPHDKAPHFIQLFKESQLSAVLEKVGDNAEASTQLYASRSGELAEKAPKYGIELYNLIWKPLDSLLQGIKTVYFSPSGLLHRIAFAALPVDHKKVLADRYALHQLGSTRSIVEKTPHSVPKAYTAELFGGIAYNRSGDKVAPDSAAFEVQANHPWAYIERPRTASESGFDYLPGTNEEIRRLNNDLQIQGVRVHTHTGAQATEEALKAIGTDSVSSPDILHIATHGFFFPNPSMRKTEHFSDENAFKWNENPLFRSGLAMAGANNAWKGEPTPANVEDGIATAYEISHLNLSNTKLVVLSACETGLGDIKGSEGVYGLQRAFKMAGADYLMVSLWQVPDQETAEFMDVFYKTWLGGKTIHEAFAKAQKKMRKKYKEVYKWGAWVLVE